VAAGILPAAPGGRKSGRGHLARGVRLPGWTGRGGVNEPGARFQRAGCPLPLVVVLV